MELELPSPNISTTPRPPVTPKTSVRIWNCRRRRVADTSGQALCFYFLLGAKIRSPPFKLWIILRVYRFPLKQQRYNRLLLILSSGWTWGWVVPCLCAFVKWTEYTLKTCHATCYLHAALQRSTPRFRENVRSENMEKGMRTHGYGESRPKTAPDGPFIPKLAVSGWVFLRISMLAHVTCISWLPVPRSLNTSAFSDGRPNTTSRARRTLQSSERPVVCPQSITCPFDSSAMVRTGNNSRTHNAMLESLWLFEGFFPTHMREDVLLQSMKFDFFACVR
jgi:hypothetical protein